MSWQENCQRAKLSGSKQNLSVDWPSPISILDSPERKRAMLSKSFADSGLGSTIFGTPPDKIHMKVNDVPPLRTPTKRRNSSGSGSGLALSPRSFIHVSPYSSSFSSIVQPSHDYTKSKLCDPKKAIGFRFSESTMEDRLEPTDLTAPEFIARSEPIAIIDENVPNTSRFYKQCFENFSHSQNIKEDSGFIDTSHFSLESSSNNPEVRFEDFLSSTLREDRLFFGHEGFVGDFYSIPEQASGPLESILSDVNRFPNIILPLSPSKAANVLTTESRSPRKAVPQQQKECVSYVSPCLPNNSSGTQKKSENLDKTFTEFVPPKKEPNPYSPSWYAIVCGGTPCQLDMMRKARDFLESLNKREIK
ncbi:unnamed protein product [Dracunculus medinensis]|uniref:Membrane-associated kinase regulator 6 n=1 Tax=Dracunculus medinensis TaxID=318479 RepID=A0A0N4U3G2_DRAME|nr:unnamed protein product [Dracunculus medinensis]